MGKRGRPTSRISFTFKNFMRHSMYVDLFIEGYKEQGTRHKEI
jgi:hypothetical protein